MSASHPGGAPNSERVYGCSRCGAMTPGLPASGQCPSCGGSPLVLLDGGHDPQQALALAAWGRRETTLLVEDQAFVLAFLAGALIGAGLGFLAGARGLWLLTTTVWAAIASALLGAVWAPKLFRWRFPRARLALIENPRLRRVRLIGLYAWLLVPPLALLCIAALGGDGSMGTRLQRLLGRLWWSLHP